MTRREKLNNLALTFCGCGFLECCKSFRRINKDLNPQILMTGFCHPKKKLAKVSLHDLSGLRSI